MTEPVVETHQAGIREKRGKGQVMERGGVPGAWDAVNNTQTQSPPRPPTLTPTPTPTPTPTFLPTPTPTPTSTHSTPFYTCAPNTHILL